MAESAGGGNGVALLGVDAGSVAVSLALVSGRGGLLAAGYAFHQGQIRPTLRRMLSELAWTGPIVPTAVGSAEGLLEGARVFDGQLCHIASARRYHGKLAGLLVVGGER